jgi:acetyltransferase
MSVHALDCILKPKRIALLGVTINPNSVGGRVLANLVGGGFRGVVYPVNSQSEAVQGVPCYPEVRDVPHTPDLAIISADAPRVPEMVRQCGEAGVAGIVIMSAGFREAGVEGRARERDVREIARGFPGMRILGPNCLGVIAPAQGLNASFAACSAAPGHVAFISQSGALCTAVLDWAADKRVGFSYFVSLGNALDVDFGDLIDYLGEDEATQAIVLYVESIARAREFMTAARAFALTKPIVAYKAGRFPESAGVAASHTGALASDDDVYDAAFRRAGIARVLRIGEVFDCAELLSRQRMPRGPRLAVVTNAGGPGVMAADALAESGGVLAALAPATVAALDEALPPFWSHGNPVDVLGDAPPRRVAKAVDAVLADAGVDAVLTVLTPQAMTAPSAVAQQLAKRAGTGAKPLLAAWMGGSAMREGIRILNDAGVATHTTPEDAVRAFMTLVGYARNLEALYETPREIRVEFSPARAAHRGRIAPPAGRDDTVLCEMRSKEILAAYGVPVAAPRAAGTADEAVRVAAAIGFPVALKVDDPAITHKTETGGVILDLADEYAVRGAFHAVERATASARAGTACRVTVQPMVRVKHGVELILGAKRDPVFGAVLVVGAGGVGAELLRDRTLGFPPVTERLARRMLEALRVWPLLAGYRGRPPADVDRLVETIVRVSYVIMDHPEIVELDVNPLVVSPDGVIALDARVRVDRAFVDQDARRYPHLALRPYPEEYVRSVMLEDGVPLMLRPIRPEDEPLWLDLLARCSRESIYSRFQHHFQASHHTAIRYCFNDYDREIAIVAEQGPAEARRLLGVGRLVTEPDLRTVEYAVLVADEAQNRGIGGLLTDYCLEIARAWGRRRVVAHTTSDNVRMVAVFERRGFTVSTDAGSGEVHVELGLAPERTEPAAVGATA